MSTADTAAALNVLFIERNQSLSGSFDAAPSVDAADGLIVKVHSIDHESALSESLSKPDIAVLILDLTTIPTPASAERILQGLTGGLEKDLPALILVSNGGKLSTQRALGRPQWPGQWQEVEPDPRCINAAISNHLRNFVHEHRLREQSRQLDHQQRTARRLRKAYEFFLADPLDACSLDELLNVAIDVSGSAGGFIVRLPTDGEPQAATPWALREGVVDPWRNLRQHLPKDLAKLIGDAATVGKISSRPERQPLLLLPLRSVGTTVGLLGLFHQSTGDDAPVMEELSDLLSTIGTAVNTRAGALRRLALEERMRRIFNLIDKAPLAVITCDTSRRIQSVNSAFTALTGFALDDVKGRDPGHVLQGPATNPDTRAKIGAQLTRFENVEVEILNYRKDGTPIWVELSIVPMRTENGTCVGFVGYQRDATARRQAARDRFESMFRRSPAQMLLTTRSYQIVDANDSLLASLGFDAQRMIGQLLPELLPGAERAQFTTAMSKADNGLVRNLELTVEDIRGEKRSWVCSAEPLEMEESTWLLWVINDISGIRRSEHKVLQAMRLQRVLIRISTAAIEDVALQEYLRDSLLLIGQVLDVSRVSIVEVSETGAMRSAHNWCSSDVDAADASNFDVPDEAGRWWLDGLQDSGLVSFSDLSGMPAGPQKELLQAKKIKATMVAALQIGERIIGMLTTSDIRAPRVWSDEELDLLRAVAQVLSGIIQRTKARESAERLANRKAKIAEVFSELASSPLIEEGNFGALTGQMTRLIARSLGFARVGVWLLIEDHGNLHNLETYTLDTNAYDRGGDLSVEESQARLVALRDRKFTLSENATTDPLRIGSVKSRLSPLGPFTRLDVAIGTGERSRGIVCLEQTVVGYEWLDDEIQLACQFADRLGVTLANAARHQAEKTLRRVNLELAEATRRSKEMALAAEHASSAKSQFLANMSHELRTPLNSVLGLTEILQMGKVYGALNDDQHRAVEQIRNSGNHLLNLIGDILDLTNIEAGKVPLIPKLINVTEVSVGALRLLEETAQAKGVSLEYSQVIELQSLTIVADEQRIRQVLFNLLSNAIKFTPSGGRVVLETGLDVTNQWVIFSVTDTGEGIPLEIQETLFKPFTQADNSTTKRFQGSGIGLSIVKRLIELHGGDITVKSIPGSGSTFSFSMPYRVTSGDITPTHADSTTSVSASPVTETTRARILIAEDNPMNVVPLRDFLLANGYEVDVATNGVEAVAAARKARYNVILMDVQMPEMDGLEATRKIRELPAYSDTPIVALTSFAMAGDRERCLSAGMTEYMSKPFRFRALGEMIQQLSSRTRL